MITLNCADCGGSNLTRSATAEWDPESTTWDIQHMEDDLWCADCDISTKIIEGYTMSDCRCCGKPVPEWYTSGPADNNIHTRCIPKHWSKHARGLNFSRCHEFSHKLRKAKR